MDPARASQVVVIWTAAVMQCYHCIGAVTLDLDLELPDALADMRGAFLYQTFVDGAPWKPAHSLCAPRVLGRSWRDVIGSDRVYVGCNQRADQFRRWSGAAQADPGLPSGRHEAYVVASLPSPGLEFRSNTVEFELRCGSPYETDYEAPPASKAGADDKSPSSLALVFGLLTLGGLLRARTRDRTRP